MMDLTLRSEQMNADFVKWHVDGMRVPAVIHRLGVDLGAPHDHPFGFTSFVICGGYREEVFIPEYGSIGYLLHLPGESFTVKAGHIHRIVELIDGECWTLIVPGSHERTPGFYEWREGQCFHRFWHEAEFSPFKVTP